MLSFNVITKIAHEKQVRMKSGLAPRFKLILLILLGSIGTIYGQLFSLQGVSTTKIEIFK